MEEVNQLDEFFCEECGSCNGCEHYYLVQEEKEDTKSDPSISNLLVDETESYRETTIEELLISFVQCRPPLWDHRIPLVERTKPIKEKLWLEILKEFGTEADISLSTLQKKWKNLRDTYIRAKSDLEAYQPSGAPQKKKKKIWKHYESLKFLSETAVPRRTISNFNSGQSSGAFETDSVKTPVKVLKKIKKDEETQQIILKALDKVVAEPSHQVTIPSISPICLRISEILAKMPDRERIKLEIKLLQTVYDESEPYLQ